MVIKNMTTIHVKTLEQKIKSNILNIFLHK